MEQSDINTNINYAFKLGNVNPDCELDKTSDFFGRYLVHTICPPKKGVNGFVKFYKLHCV